MYEVSDKELITQVAHGCRDAYRQLLQRQLPAVSRYVDRMLGQAAETEDIVQEVFLRLWTQASRYDPGVAQVSTWLHRIAHNLCIDFFRKQQPLDFEAQPKEASGGSEPDAEHRSGMLRQDVRLALLNLPERQRSALILCHFQELSNKEAAAVLEISVDALESLLARARRTLRSTLENPHGLN